MAKKKISAQMAMPMSGTKGEVGARVESAENGFIIHVNRESHGKTPSYESKRFIATNQSKAMRIASHHLRGAEQKIKSKRGKKTRSGGR
jgi:hypothetical protein